MTPSNWESRIAKGTLLCQKGCIEALLLANLPLESHWNSPTHYSKIKKETISFHSILWRIWQTPYSYESKEHPRQKKTLGESTHVVLT